MSFTIHAATLEVATVLTSAVMAAALLWTFRLRRLNRALLWWAATFAFAALHAVSLFRNREETWPLGTFVDELSLLAAGFCCWFGFRAFNDRGSPIWLLFVVCFVFFAGMFIVPLPEKQTLNAAIVVLLVLTVLSARAALEGPQKDRSWRLLAGGLLAAHAVFLVVRIASDPGTPLPPVIQADNLLHVFFVVEPMILPVVLGYTLLGLVYDREQQESLAAQHTDLLTGTLNRRGLEALLARADRRRAVSMVVFDLDRFKQINDTYGHGVGDEVLSAAASRIRARLRPEDAVVRLGGEEFLLVMPGVESSSAAAAAERARVALAEEPLALTELEVSVTASFGVVSLPPGWTRPAFNEALERADKALYSAKHEGRNAVRSAA
ncbi:MAG: GGDEF domain-containing protein [Pseudomonadota bacterium]